MSRFSYLRGMYLSPDNDGGGTVPAPVVVPVPAVEIKKEEEVSKPLTLTQKDLDAAIEKATLEGKASAEKAQQNKDTEAQRQSDISKGEWEKVAKGHEATIAELSPKAEASVRYSTRINEIIDSEIKGWPVEVSKLDPGANKLDERMTWVENSRDLAKRLSSLSQAPNGQHGQGNGGGNGESNNAATNYLNRHYKGPASVG